VIQTKYNRDLKERANNEFGKIMGINIDEKRK